MRKYLILRCHKCGEVVHYAKYIRTTCTSCSKKLDPSKSYILASYDKPAEAGYVEQRVKEELARKYGVQLAKGANYVGLKEAKP